MAGEFYSDASVSMVGVPEACEWCSVTRHGAVVFLMDPSAQRVLLCPHPSSGDVEILWPLHVVCQEGETDRQACSRIILDATGLRLDGEKMRFAGIQLHTWPNTDGGYVHEKASIFYGTLSPQLTTKVNGTCEPSGNTFEIITEVLGRDSCMYHPAMQAQLRLILSFRLQYSLTKAVEECMEDEVVSHAASLYIQSLEPRPQSGVGSVAWTEEDGYRVVPA